MSMLSTPASPPVRAAVARKTDRGDTPAHPDEVPTGRVLVDERGGSGAGPRVVDSTTMPFPPWVRASSPGEAGAPPIPAGARLPLRPSDDATSPPLVTTGREPANEIRAPARARIGRGGAPSATPVVRTTRLVNAGDDTRSNGATTGRCRPSTVAGCEGHPCRPVVAIILCWNGARTHCSMPARTPRRCSLATPPAS